MPSKPTTPPAGRGRWWNRRRLRLSLRSSCGAPLTKSPTTTSAPTGPVQHHLLEARTQHRLDGLIAGEAEPVLKWLGWIHEAAPTTIEDPATIRVARECAEADPDGTRLRAHVQAATGRALPDDHKADALRYRLEPWLNQVWETVTPQPPGTTRTATCTITLRDTAQESASDPPLLGARRAPTPGRNRHVHQPEHSRVETEWVSLREAAKIYAVSTYTLRCRISSGDLPAVKLGYKLIRVRVSDLDKLFPAIPTNRPEDRYRRW